MQNRKGFAAINIVCIFIERQGGFSQTNIVHHFKKHIIFT
jgi:hypothetical protein